MKRFLLVAVVFLLPFCVSAQIKAKVIGIKDGDTIEVLLEGNIMKTLRLAEVDCPEKGQPYGKNAKKFTSDRVFGKEIIYIRGKDCGRTPMSRLRGSTESKGAIRKRAVKQQASIWNGGLQNSHWSILFHV